MMMKPILTLLAASLLPMFAQTTINGSRAILGTWDAGGSLGTIPFQKGLISALPGTCTQGAVYFATDAPAGQQVYHCSATNTWSRAGYATGSSDPGSCSVGQAFFNTTLNALKLCVATDTWRTAGSSNCRIEFSLDNTPSVLVADTSAAKTLEVGCILSRASINGDESGAGSIAITVQKAAWTTGAASWTTISSGFQVSSAYAVEVTDLAGAGWSGLTIGDKTKFRISATGTPAGFKRATVILEGH